MSDIFKSFSFVMDFKDPASLYIESLIGVHNNVMWYLVLIVTIVYWTLYKILKDSIWTSFSKQVGFLRIFFSTSLFLDLYSLVILLYVRIYYFFLRFFLDVLSDIIYIVFGSKTGTLDKNLDFFSKFFFYNLDQALFKEGVKAPYWVNLISSKNAYSFFREIWTQKYLDNLLFGATNAGYFFYGRTANFDSALTTKYSPFLTVQQFKHSTLLEVVWATFPSVIILLILVPSILLIYSIDEDLDPEYTIKVVGHQWFWSYEFDGWLPASDLILKQKPRLLNSAELSRIRNSKEVHVPNIRDILTTSRAMQAINSRLFKGHLLPFRSFEFDSCMVITDSLELGQRRLLEVDNPLIVPCSVGLRFLITSADVLHAWALPQLGIKVDAVPGRLSQYITMLRRPGIFYGQCSEICGVAHAFMPIVVHGAPYSHVLPMWTDFLRISW